MRYLAELNPSPGSALRADREAELPLYPMESIHEFGSLDQPQTRVVGELLTGYSYIEPQDVAFAKVTPCFENGKGLLGTELVQPSFATSEVTVLRPRRGVDQRFLAYVLQSSEFRERAIGSMTGAGGLQRVSEQFVRDYSVRIPSWNEQQLVADYLDRETAEIDAFIADLDSLEAVLQERLTAFIESRIAAIDTSALEVRRLRPLRQTGVSVNAASEPASPGEAGVLKTGAASKGWFDPGENKAVVVAAEIKRLSGALVTDRVLVNRANTPELVGMAAYIGSAPKDLYLSDKLWSLDFEANNEFMAMLLATRSVRDQIRLLSVGASSSMQNLSYEDFLSLKVKVPDRAEQEQIVLQARREGLAVREASAEIVMARDLAKERRAALISAAVTGQIDVDNL